MNGETLAMEPAAEAAVEIAEIQADAAVEIATVQEEGFTERHEASIEAQTEQAEIVAEAIETAAETDDVTDEEWEAWVIRVADLESAVSTLGSSQAALLTRVEALTEVVQTLLTQQQPSETSTSMSSETSDEPEQEEVHPTKQEPEKPKNLEKEEGPPVKDRKVKHVLL
jgi:hypothetical protein